MSYTSTIASAIALPPSAPQPTAQPPRPLGKRRDGCKEAGGSFDHVTNAKSRLSTYYSSPELVRGVLRAGAERPHRVLRRFGDTRMGPVAYQSFMAGARDASDALDGQIARGGFGVATGAAAVSARERARAAATLASAEAAARLARYEARTEEIRACTRREAATQLEAALASQGR